MRVGNIQQLISTPEFTRDFLSHFKPILPTVKIKYASFISEDQLVFEFATDEDKELYRTSDEVKFIIVE